MKTPEFRDRALDTESGKTAPEGLFAEIAEAMLDDYANIDVHIHRLREFGAALRGGRAPTVADSVAVIEDLECELIPHFTAEALEEFLGSLVTDDPPWLERIARLGAEHAKLAEALAHWVELAACNTPPVALAEGLDVLLDTLEAHERAERALMREFVRLDDVGPAASR
jgi:hypothetical protein